MPLKLATVNLTWTPVAGSSGYDILLDNAKVSNAGPNAKTTKIFIPEGGQHKVTVKAQPSGQVQDARFEWTTAVPDPPHAPNESFTAPTPLVTA